MFSHLTQAISIAVAAFAAVAAVVVGASTYVLKSFVTGPETGFRSTAHQEGGHTRFEMTADAGDIECELDLEFAVRDTSNQAVAAQLGNQALRVESGAPVGSGPGAFRFRLRSAEGIEDAAGAPPLIRWRTWDPISVLYQDLDARLRKWTVWLKDGESDSSTKAWTRRWVRRGLLLALVITAVAAGLAATRRTSRRRQGKRMTSLPPGPTRGTDLPVDPRAMVDEIVAGHGDPHVAQELHSFLAALLAAESPVRALDTLDPSTRVYKQQILLIAKAEVERHESRKVV